MDERSRARMGPVLGEIGKRLEDPTARGLARAVSRAVADGAITAGDRLPPIRAIADELGVSPTTVSAAWAVLARAGTIRTDGRRGTVITTRPAAAPRRYQRALERAHAFELDLSTGVPDATLLPDVGPALSRLPALAPETYLDEPVVPELVEHLRADWPYPAERITVADGAMDALDLITGCFLSYGERVAVENPCFPPLLDLLESAGVEVVPVALDAHGPRPDAVAAAVRAGARAFFLQPRAQNPTGVSLSAERVDELAAALGAADVLVVENDSMGAVASAPARSLGARLPDRTLHVRSFSKSHGPDLRLAALSGPAALIGRLVDRRHLGQGWTSRLLQRLLLDLLTQPASVAQVEHARVQYARRRAALVTALAQNGIELGAGDGLNIWLPVADEPGALVGLATRGIGVAPGAPFVVGRPAGAHVRVTCAGLADRHAQVAAELAAAADWHAFTAPR